MITEMKDAADHVQIKTRKSGLKNATVPAVVKHANVKINVKMGRTMIKSVQRNANRDEEVFFLEF